MSCPWPHQTTPSTKGQVSRRHFNVIDSTPAGSRRGEKSVIVDDSFVFRNLGSRFAYGCSGEGSKDHSPGQIGECSRSKVFCNGGTGGAPVHLEKQLRSVSCRPSDLRISVKDEQADHEECPICTEALDATDKSFASCPCGFKLCLFCHHTIKANDGRCPGCRMIYKTTIPKASRSKRT